MIEHIGRLLPGILFCIAITIAALLLQAIEVHYVGQAYLEALVLAILLGVAVRTAWTPASRLAPGIAFSGKFLLEFAVVLLGASVSSNPRGTTASLPALSNTCERSPSGTASTPTH